MKRTIQVMIILVTLASFLGACLPAAAPATSGEPAAAQAQNTQSLEDTQSQINTAVAQTIEAQNQIGTAVALTTEAQATPTFTATAVTIPTFTPLALPTATNRPSTGGSTGGSSSGKYDYACDIMNRRPFDNAEILHGQDFDIKWTIQNTGTKTWDPGMDVKYFSGPQMTSVTVVEIPIAMKPGDTYQIVMDAKAPAQTGFQVMTWTVQGQLCYPYVALMVH
ncbi:MAG: hypothetical protein KA473_10670 [Anaerolineales bacterium]|nr:hypothetical protein [Anaerolineales bacterium]MBP6209887.1 hypothetical protein [Anaerolineales bacterium]MBP8164843.1 hypothetical protein [Anaerolineales bacterium]